MNQILTKIREVDPNNSDAVKDAVSTFLQNLSKHLDGDSNRWLRALEDVINRFPKYCASQRNTIETFLAHFSNSSYYSNVIEAAKCCHSLQQVRPPQEKTATPKVCWREHQLVLCNTAQKLIAELFPTSVDIYSDNDGGKKLQLQSTENSPIYKSLNESTERVVNKQLVLSTKLKNVFVYLQAMLVEPFPVAKPIQPQTILEVIARVLNVSSATKSTLDIATRALIKIQALKTLDALVACLGSNLIPYSALVIRIVNQTLRWSSEHNDEHSRQVRRAAYESATRALPVLGHARAADDICDHIAADITPLLATVQLTMNPQSMKRLSKKARRKLANSMLQESSIAAHMPGEKNKVIVSDEENEAVALAALDCADVLFTYCGIFLKPTVHKSFQERLVRDCFHLSNYSEERALGMLRALDALRKGSPHSVAPPTQYCLQLYSSLLNSRLPNVAKFCSQALLDIRLHLHCGPPSLTFALESQEKKSATEKRKKISDKNKAALVALLGKDSLQDVEGIEEEIIDISDEPLNKKSRLSLEEDRISLSSDSEDSLVDLDETEADECAIVETDDTNEVVQSNNDADIVTNAAESSTELDNCYTNGVDVPISQQNEDLEERERISNDIHEAQTQLPINASNDTVDGERSPVSMEVVYDFPNTGNDKVTVIEIMEGDNLPSTNDTDDVQITCGQIVNNSQEINVEKENNDEDKENEEAQVNGEKSLEIDTVSQKSLNKDDDLTNKLSNKDVNVEDMLADFVDEVNEELKA